MSKTHHRRSERITNRRTYKAITAAVDCAEAANVLPERPKDWFLLADWERELLEMGAEVLPWRSLGEEVLTWRERETLRQEAEAEAWAHASGLDFDRMDLGECESGEVYGADLEHDEGYGDYPEDDDPIWDLMREESYRLDQEQDEDLHNAFTALMGERMPEEDMSTPAISQAELAAMAEEGFTYKVLVPVRLPSTTNVRTPGMRVKHLAERLGFSNSVMIRALRKSGEWVNTEQSTVPAPVVREWLDTCTPVVRKSPAAAMAAVHAASKS